jgi:hypothetical protein
MAEGSRDLIAWEMPMIADGLHHKKAATGPA